MSDPGAPGLWDLPEVAATWAVAPLPHGPVLGRHPDTPVTPASVLKVQVALAVAEGIETGRLDGRERVRLDPSGRTPGPVGMSLMADPVETSLRDLLVPMLTVSDNVATDAVLAAVGIDRVNEMTEELGLSQTRIFGDLRTMLDGMAVEAGFADYAELDRHDPERDGPPTWSELTRVLADSSALDPGRGSRTTAADQVRLLDLVWADRAATPAACARVRWLMARQVSGARIRSGFPAGTAVAAKSGGLMGVVRNEVGVVEGAGRPTAVAVFTRRAPDSTVPGDEIDAAIGRLARRLVDAVS